MAGYDPREVVALCDSIVEDGELSLGEIRELTEYLAQNAEARQNWPGNLFAEVLKSALEDGKITRAEARTIGKLLLAVSREWAKRTAPASSSDEAAIVARALESFTGERPVLPSIPVRLRVESRTDRGEFHDVELGGPSCTCPDFRGRRSHLAQGDLTRCCKHVLTAFAQVEPAGGWPSWVQAFIANGFHPHPLTRWGLTNVDGGAPVLVSSAPNGWCIVFAPGSKGYERFGYNIQERRWAYGAEPDGADALGRFARALDADKDRRGWWQRVAGR